MLWHKAWLETRSRFIIALVGCVALCSMLEVEFGREAASSSRGLAGILGELHVIHMFLALVWVLAIILLMMGGLLQEKAVGASSFTLALPVSRLRLMSVRVGMGLLQAIVLAVIPWIGMLFFAGVAGKPYFISQACFHVFLLLSGGSLFLAFLISSLVESQYIAPVLSIGVSGMLVYAVRGEKLDSYSPWTFMVGSEYFQWRTGLLGRHVSFTHAAIFVTGAALLIMISIKIIQRQDF